MLARFGVVLFAQSEVDEPRFVVVAQQNVGGLHVEVRHLVLVDKAECVGYLEDIARGFGFAEVALAFYLVMERAVLCVLHDVVGRAVLLEHVNDAYDIGVLQFGNVARLLEKLIAVAFNELAAAFGGNRDMVCVGIAHAEILHEELLDGHDAVQPLLQGEVGDAEAALAKYALYFVFAILQGAAWL